MELLIVCSLLTSAGFYLGSRATITSWLWGLYPPTLARFMDCPACVGTWIGFILGGLLWLCGHSIIPAEVGAPAWCSPVVLGLCSMVWTPIVAGMMQAGFERLGSAVSEPEPEHHFHNDEDR